MAGNKRPRANTGDGLLDRQTEDAVEQKARKACINCRRQKMKCIVEGNSDACRRCQRSDLPCIFVPRANAAKLPVDIEIPASLTDVKFKESVLRRLALIEDILDIPGVAEPGPEDRSEDDSAELDPEYSSLTALWDAAQKLESSAPSSVPSSIWRKSTVKQLWSSFHDRMPGLHFMPRKQTFSVPQPLLLASMLYVASARGPPDMAHLAPHYFVVLCSGIAQLCIPDSEVGKIPDNAEEWAFQTVLGIVLAGLLTEAAVRETDIWISIAYRLLLKYSPSYVDDTSREWRKLFSGVQIIDLEHASIHLSCPFIPLVSPLPGLRIPPRDQLYRLSCMMHTGLTHFTGRGLPTIWSCFEMSPQPINLTSTFTAVDAAVIRDWARQLDEWLAEFSQRFDGFEQDRKLVFRQYVLHRLLVLSIYHPARGCDLWSNSITPSEQHELLLSARATLKLHINDDSIWSNWDFIMITWAALIVIQGVEGGAGEADDLNNIRVHLDILKRMNEPESSHSLYDKLITRLEENLSSVHTPSSTEMQQTTYSMGAGSSIDQSWQIFDQASLQQMMYPSLDSLQAMQPQAGPNEGQAGWLPT